MSILNLKIVGLEDTASGIKNIYTQIKDLR
jgi:hypothetical protein